MAMEKLSTAGADLFLAGHLHVSHIGHTAERYQIAGHSALVVQAGTVSTRSRGEHPSFNVLRIQRPHISVARLVWEQTAGAFTETAESRVPTHRRWMGSGVTERLRRAWAGSRASTPRRLGLTGGKPRLRRVA